MDIVSLTVILGIAAYVLVEYRRRERDHQRVLATLRRGERPAEFERLSPLWTLFTTGGTLIIALGATGYVIHLAIKAHPRYASPLIVLTGACVMVTVVVALLFARNVAGFRHTIRPGRGSAR